MIPVTAEVLKRLAQPFIDQGATKLFFARHLDRVRVGTEPATAIRSGSGTPNNIEAEASELDAARYEALAAELNAS